MDQNKIERYYRRIRTFAFADDLEAHFETYCETNEITSEEGENMRAEAIAARNAAIKKRGRKKLALALLILATAFSVFLLSKEMLPVLKKFILYFVYGLIAIGSLFFSSGLLNVLAPGKVRGEIVDLDLE